VEVEFSKEAYDDVVTTVRILGLEPVIKDPDIEGWFIYQEDGMYTSFCRRQEESLVDDIKRAERVVRAATAWYIHLVTNSEGDE